MSRIALALLSLLFFAAMPSQLPGKTTQHHRPHSKDKTAHGKDKKTATPNPTATAQFTATPDQEAAHQVASRDEKKAEPIRVAPADVHLNAVHVHKDWIDRSFVLFSGLLVIVGPLQVWLLCGSLRATQKAANAAKKSADVAESALYQVQGAHLYVIKVEQPIDLHVSVIIHNAGQTAAYIYESSIQSATFAKAVPPPVYRKVQHYPVPVTLLPGEKTPLGPYTIFGREKAPQDLAPTEGRLRALTRIVYGFLKYEDVFGRRFQMGFGTIENRPGEYTRFPSREYNYLRPIENDVTENE